MPPELPSDVGIKAVDTGHKAFHSLPFRSSNIRGSERSGPKMA